MLKNPEKFFYAANGAVLKDTKDMFKLLKTIDKSTFKHHVSKDNNDFYNWTRFALKDNVLAKKLDKAKNKKEMIAAIEKRLNLKSKKNETIISQIKEAINNG